MSYYIVRKNTETGLFEILKDSNGDGPKEYHSEIKAIEQYQAEIEWRGKDNIMLLESVPLKVTVVVEKRV
ncbi:MAG: hypothetical protein KAJ19_23765 [Gammaproteobacteria bacterium]|nr:hypothetical protein [Gammaproteobacteria bacterium]